MTSPTSQTPAAPGQASGRVLIVDDEAPVREIATLVLQHLGFAVEGAADAEAALRAVAHDAERFDLLLIDMTMPGQDGMETLRALRERGANAPAILMSGFAEQQLRQRSAGAGVAGFLQKPFDYGTLRATVDAARQRRT